MNQILIIRNLNAWIKGESNIINMTNDGYLTPGWMFDKGMYVCYSCGHINSIDNQWCGKCNDERFSLTEKTAALTARRPYKNRKSVKII